MPLIPKLNNTSINTTVPAANIKLGDGGRGEAMARLGNVVTNIGIELTNQTMEAEAKDYAANRKIGDTLKIEEYKKESLKKYADAPDKYSEDVKTFIDKTYQRSQEDAPTGLAQEIYKGATQGSFVREQISTDEFAQNQKLDIFKVNNVNRTQAISTFAYKSSDPVKVSDLMNTQLNVIEANVGTVVSRKEAELEKMKVKQEVSGSYFQGLLDEENYDIAKKVIKDDSFPVTAALTVDQRSRIENRLDNAIKQKQATNTQALKLELNAATSLMRSGVFVPPSDLARIENGLKSLPQDESVRAARVNLKADIALMNEAQSLATTSRSEWGGRVGSISEQVNAAINSDESLAGQGSDLVKQSIVLQTQGRLQTVMSDLIKQQNKDPAGYIHKHYPKMQEMASQVSTGNLGIEERSSLVGDYIRQSISLQRNLGITEPKILSAREADVYADNFKSTGNSDLKASLVQGIKYKFADHSSQVFAELMDAEKVDPIIMVAAQVNDPISMSRVFSNTENKEEKINNYRVRFGQASLNDLRATIKENMKEEIGIIARGDLNGSDSKYLDAITENVLIDVAQSSLSNDSNSSIKDKIRNAKSVIFGSQVVLSGGSSKVMMPVTPGNNHLATETFLNVSNTPKNIGYFDVAMTSEYKNSVLKNNPSATDDDIKQRYNKQISENSFWAKTSNPQEVKLMYQHPTFGPINLKNSKNEPIKVKFSDMKNIDFVQDSIGGFDQPAILRRRQQSFLGNMN